MNVALRIAWREMRRSKGRSALIIAMIALPVACLSFAAIAYDSFQVSPATRITRELGTADAQLRWLAAEPITQDENGFTSHHTGPPDLSWVPPGKTELLALLPPGSRVIPDHSTMLTVRTPSGIGDVGARVTEIGDPMLDGRTVLLEGKAPGNPAEVNLTAGAASWLGLGVGAKLRTVGPDQEFTVSGIVEFPHDLSRSVVLHPGASGLVVQDQNWLADTPAPVDAALAKRLNDKGIFVVVRELKLAAISEYEPEVQAGQIGAGVSFTALAILEIVLITAPAFAVGARRRARDLALIAATGAEPKHLRRLILADGTVLGLTGAAIGLVTAVIAVAAGRPLLEQIVQQRADGWRFFPLALLVICTVAVFSAVLAAMVPAFVAARQNVITVLSGRRGVTRSRRRWIVTGFVVCATGVLTAAAGALLASEELLVIGLVLFELGLVVLTPAIIGLVARSGRWLPLTVRLSMRDISRNRSSAAPAISAVMAAVAGATSVGLFFWSMDDGQERSQDQYLPKGSITIMGGSGGEVLAADWARAGDLAREAYPGAAVAPVYQPVCKSVERCNLTVVLPPEQACPYFGPHEPSEQDRIAASKDPRCASDAAFHWAWRGTAVDDGSGFEVLTGLTGDKLAQAQKLLATGGAVVAHPGLIKDGMVTLEMDGQTYRAPGLVIDGLPNIAGTVVSPHSLAALELGITGLVIKPARTSGEQEQEHLSALLREQFGMRLYATTGEGFSGNARLDGFLFTLAAGVLALAAAGIATGLTTSDARTDLHTLSVIGAAPKLRRRFTVSSAGVIAGLGALMGVATGFVVTFAIITGVNRFDQLNAIWPLAPELRLGINVETILVILAVPLLAMLGAALFSRSRLPIERRI